METKTKVCCMCHKRLPLNQFCKDSSRKDDKCIYCKKCRNEWYKEYRKRNPEKMKEKDRRYNEKRNFKSDYERVKKNQERLRLLALNKLSNSDPKCVFCQFDNIKALDIDHINENGAEERKKLSSVGVWRKISGMTDEDAKKEYQILCKNCNWLKYLNRKQKA